MTPSLTPPSFWKLNFMKITVFISHPDKHKHNWKIISTINVTYAPIQINRVRNIASNYFNQQQPASASPRSQMLWFFSVNYVINSGVQPVLIHGALGAAILIDTFTASLHSGMPGIWHQTSTVPGVPQFVSKLEWMEWLPEPMLTQISVTIWCH